MSKIIKSLIACIVLMMLLGTTSVVLADCTKDGAAYPTGTVIGGFICTEDGTWKKK